MQSKMLCLDTIWLNQTNISVDTTKFCLIEPKVLVDLTKYGLVSLNLEKKIARDIDLLYLFIIR